MRALSTADPFLTTFFAGRRKGVSPILRDRIDRTEADLRLAIELAEVDVLGPDELALVAAEREFEPSPRSPGCCPSRCCRPCCSTT